MPEPDERNVFIEGAMGWADPTVGPLGRAASAFAVAYALSPFDFFPEIALPVVGYADDAAVLFLAGHIVRSQRRNQAPRDS